MLQDRPRQLGCRYPSPGGRESRVSRLGFAESNIGRTFPPAICQAPVSVPSRAFGSCKVNSPGGTPQSPIRLRLQSGNPHAGLGENQVRESASSQARDKKLQPILHGQDRRCSVRAAGEEGRNYSEHIKELSNDTPREPMFFLKPTTSYLPSGGDVQIPQGVTAHYEVELGIVIGKTGRDVSQADAESYVAGYALAVDMTARNMQDEVKKKRHPWSAVKGFDTFTPISSYIPKSSVSDPHNLNLTLKVNGVTKQDGNTSNMIFPLPRIIEHVSSIMTLEEGDLILTGTPSGVGPIVPGDRVECALADSAGKQLATLSFGAVQRRGGYHFVPE
ncbi:hypothetical protein AcW1_005990 [Taiwanofungus camphoratus]|nr:hypothetical protein AcW1_005990 [Antrodia cinnamomea]